MSGPELTVVLAVVGVVALGADAVLVSLDTVQVRRRVLPRRPPSSRRAAAVMQQVVSWRPGGRRRHQQHTLDSLAPMLDDVARHTRTGRSVPAAITAALATRAELTTWFAHRGPQTDLPTEAALASRALTVAAASPSNAADTCERAARAIRDRRAVTAERAAQSTPARLSARVMTLLPLAVAAWSVAVDATVRQFLLATPLGWACLASGLGLNLAGRWWINRLVAGGLT